MKTKTKTMKIFHPQFIMDHIVDFKKVSELPFECFSFTVLLKLIKNIQIKFR